ncbi:hypothetical protein [Demequina sp.]|uniref:hypothetical protein n=1 Tax=Demequina sp. TaxID=2050685 RepID=UPI003D098DBD
MAYSQQSLRSQTNVYAGFLWVYYVFSMLAIGLLFGQLFQRPGGFDGETAFNGTAFWGGAGLAAVLNIPLMVFFYLVRLGVLQLGRAKPAALKTGAQYLADQDQ